MGNLHRTSDFSLGSMFNTLNPLSQASILSTKKDYVPKWIQNAGNAFFSRLPQHDRGDAAQVVFKTGVDAAAIGALVYLSRRLAHKAKMLDIDAAKTPGAKLKEQMDASFNQPVNVQDLKAVQGVKKKASMSIRYLSSVAPTMAAIIAGLAAYNKADKLSDDELSKYLDSQIKDKQSANNKLTLARAMQARDKLDKKTYNKIMASTPATDDIKVTKQASLGKQAGWLSDLTTGLSSSLGLVSGLLLAGSGIAAYNYFSQTDPKNIRYGAVKKGLQDYARTKSLQTPIDIQPMNPAILAALDQKSKPQTIRDAPQLQGDNNRMLSIDI